MQVSLLFGVCSESLILDCPRPGWSVGESCGGAIAGELARADARSYQRCYNVYMSAKDQPENLTPESPPQPQALACADEVRHGLPDIEASAVIKGPLATEALPVIDRDIFCQTCGYNLRGLISSRCPECGTSIENIRDAKPQIPWMYRRTLGWFRAYWKTVFFVMFRQNRFADEMAKPVSFPESQRFRWVTVGMGMLGLVIGGSGPLLTCGLSMEYIVVIGLLGLVCGFLLLAGMTGAPSYLFHPKQVSVLQQNRAIGLSYYACGPLALLAIPAVALAVGEYFGFDHPPGGLAILLGVTIPMGLLAAWWLDLIHLSRRLLSQRPARAVGVALIVPGLWFFVAVVCVGVVPGLIFALTIIVRTVV